MTIQYSSDCTAGKPPLGFWKYHTSSAGKQMIHRRYPASGTYSYRDALQLRLSRQKRKNGTHFEMEGVKIYKWL